MAPYSSGQGHHIPAKKVFEGVRGFDPHAALAIPKAVLDKLKIKHSTITGAQASLYNAFSKTGKKFTWKVIEDIETKALMKAGVDAKKARAIVQEAIKDLKKKGFTPAKIPWSA